jgi:hypothetical protein
MPRQRELSAKLLGSPLTQVGSVFPVFISGFEGKGRRKKREMGREREGLCTKGRRRKMRGVGGLQEKEMEGHV